MAEARIFKPAKTAMQSGARTRKWVLAYEPASRRQPDPLVVELRRDHAPAVGFADRLGLDYAVTVPHETAEKPKSYADNFRYDRVRT